MRSTRIRTLDRTLVTVPNAEFSTLAADQLRHVLAALRRLLRADPRVDPDPARVRFVGFGEHSLELEVFAYIRTRDFDEFLAIREDLLLQIMDCVAASGSGFAFPSQTVYTAKDPGLDEERSRAAIEEVRRWCEAAATPSPDPRVRRLGSDRWPSFDPRRTAPAPRAPGALRRSP